MRLLAIAAVIVVCAVCAAAEPLAPTLVFPSDHGVIGHPDPAARLTPFVWKSVPGAVRYRVMLDFSHTFNKPLFDKTVSETTQMLTGLDVGKYYWRVAAIDREGVEGPFSEGSRFRVDRVSADAGPSGMVGHDIGPHAVREGQDRTGCARQLERATVRGAARRDVQRVGERPRVWPSGRGTGDGPGWWRHGEGRHFRLIRYLMAVP